MIYSVRAGAGLVGMTFCPGKQQRVSLTGGWSRDVEADVASICAWGATIVVCLMEEHELRELQVTHLPEAVRRAGLEWLHMPIVEGCVPGVNWEARWRDTGPRLRDALIAGGRMVIHCNGGLGRTGTVCARLLIELGVDADTAIQTVREARPGAIENKLQEDYIRQLRRSDTASDGSLYS